MEEMIRKMKEFSAEQMQAGARPDVVKALHFMAEANAYLQKVAGELIDMVKVQRAYIAELENLPATWPAPPRIAFANVRTGKAEVSGSYDEYLGALEAQHHRSTLAARKRAKMT